jgi:hypothetical protein
MIILKLKKKKFIKTLGYENISSKAEIMEDQTSNISLLKIFDFFWPHKSWE